MKAGNKGNSGSMTIGGWGAESDDKFAEKSKQCDENGESYIESNENYLKQSEY